MSSPWKPLVQKARPSLYSWGGRRAKLGTKPSASCTQERAGRVTAGPVHEAVGLVTRQDTRLGSRGGSGPPLSPEPLGTGGCGAAGAAAVP